MKTRPLAPWLGTGVGLALLISGLRAAETRQVLDLGGTWQYQKVAQLDYPPPGNWQSTTVPGTLSGFNYERAWFRRSVALPTFPGDTRVRLRFGGVKFNCVVRVNGSVVGGCVNGYNPFELDVTSAARPGQVNEILVGLTDWTGLFSGPVDFSNLQPGESPRDRARDVILAPIGGRYDLYGLWEPVTIELVPSASIAEVFVQPSVRNQELKVRLRVRNESAGALDGTVAARVLAEGTEVLSFAPLAMALGAGETVEAVLTRPWTDPRRWEMADPFLYQLETTFTPAAGPSDTVLTRFGFREFWASGDGLFLNGTRLNLRATSSWPPGRPMSRDAIRRVLLEVKAGNNVAFRLHTQPWPELWYEVADEVGLLLVEEAAVWCDPRAYRLGDPVFWSNYADHLRAAVQRDQNHPSIVLWSLENEILHCGGGEVHPNAAAELAKLGRLVKSLDPTRPITYEADLDPEGVADVIGLHYPHEYPDHLLWPDTAWWMDAPIAKSYAPGGTWKWDRSKPLYIGEFLWISETAAAAFTPLYGDAAYADPIAYRNRAKALTWPMQIQAYRDYGVSALCPWTMFEDRAATGDVLDLNPDRNELYQAQAISYHPHAVTLREYDRRFFVGETVPRTFTIFNDTVAPAAFTLRWGVDPDRESRTFALNPAARRTESVTVRVPPTPGPFTLAVELHRDTDLVFSNALTCQAFAPRPLTIPPTTSLALHDPAGSTAALFQRQGLAWKPMTNLAADAYTGFRVLVIGRDALTNTPVPEIGLGGAAARWMSFMKDGGWILVLEQSHYPHWMPLGLSLVQEASHFAFPTADHPVVDGLEPEDLRWWRGDHRVAHRQIRVPSVGNFRVLAHIGGADGLERAGILEARFGRGGLLCSQLRLSELGEAEPIAGTLLQRLLDHTAAARPAPRHVGLLAESDSAAARTLGRLGLLAEDLRGRVTTAELSRYPLILVAGGGGAWAEAESALNRLTHYVHSGGVLWLHRPPDSFLTNVDDSLFTEASWETNLTLPVLRSDPTAPPGYLTSHDLYWTDDEGSWNRPAVFATNIATRALRRRFNLTNFVTLQAESMPIKTTGSAVTGGWNLFANGYVAQNIHVAQGGPHLFGALARGSAVAGVWPRLSLRIDGVFQDAVSVTASNWSLFGLSAQLTAGPHELALAFDNDAYAPPEDRNLYLDQVRYGLDSPSASVHSLTRPGVLVSFSRGAGTLLLDEVNWEDPGPHVTKAERLVSSLLTQLGAPIQPSRSLNLEAEQMSPVDVAAGATNGGVVWLYSSGRLQTPVRFAETGSYQFEITALGTPAQGVYPRVELRIDGVGRGAVSIPSSNPVTVALTAPVAAGQHTVAVAFINDLWAPPEDRNVGLDRLVIRPESRPEILDLHLRQDPPRATVAWSATPGRSYDVESSAEPGSGTWTRVGTAVATGTVAVWDDDGSGLGSPPGGPDRPRGFYRIRSRLP